ncbi:MAG: SDR family NAD(P)-dependent oxidoreductase [Rhodovarius sp.]|nr:SDR family NAD(P)-dependent oxidoreductase [Rhodovarius sp.]
MSRRFAHVLITGASSGIGAALAQASAAPGVVLHLGGRDAGRLASVAERCRSLGAAAYPARIDVRDASAMAEWIGGAGRLDLVVANAGVGAGTGHGCESPADARTVFETNLTGALNTVLPAIAVMAAQPPGRDGWRGRVAVVSSLAAFIAASSAPAYCASKAALQRWAEARDATERRRGIRLHAICPGFVRTPMTARNPFPMPWLMTPEEAAQRILAGLAAGRRRIVFPWPLYALARLAGALPQGLVHRLMEWLPPKPPLHAG